MSAQMKDKLRELAERLDVLAHAVTETNWSEFSMRVPVEPERDADCVLSQAAIEIRSYAGILDAEGDDGVRGDVPKLFSGDLEVLASLGFPKTAKRIRDVLAAHPARSGVVSDEDVRDAARYRWWRKKAGVNESYGFANVYIPCGNSRITEADAATTDEAIDAAMLAAREVKS